MSHSDIPVFIQPAPPAGKRRYDAVDMRNAVNSAKADALTSLKWPRSMRAVVEELEAMGLKFSGIAMQNESGMITAVVDTNGAVHWCFENLMTGNLQPACREVSA